MNAAYTQALEALELVAETPEVRGGVFVLDQQDMAFVRKAVAALRAADASGPTLNKKDLNKLLNDFARACAFADDVLERMAATKAIHEYLNVAFAAFASHKEAP